MHYAELCREKIAVLPADRQAEILRYIEAVAGEPSCREPHSPQQAKILREAWGAWGRMSQEEIDRTLAAMRGEWDRDPPWNGSEP